MSLQWNGFLWVILAYFLGAIPFGYLLVRFSRGLDIRSFGSGNIGATNVLRITGRSIALLTLVLDLAKGYLAVLATSHFTHQNRELVALAAATAVVGHVFPVYLKFKGGKGVATGVGVFLFLSPPPILASVAIFLLVVSLSRFVSLGSIIGTASFPILYFFSDYRKEPSLPTLLATLFCSSLVILRHSDNIKRLMAGTENKLSGMHK